MTTAQFFNRIALAAALALGAVGAAQAEGTIRIGAAGPQTGPAAQYGDMVFTGVQAAVADINNAGGINGSKLEIVYYDDACDPKQAVAVANKVVNDGIRFVVGHVCSGATLAAVPIYDDEGVLMVTPSATQPEVTSEKRRLTFRTIGLDNVQGTIAADYIVKKYKGKKIAVLHDKQQYGEGVATVVRDGVKAGGVDVVMFEGLNAGDKDFSALVTKLKSAGVEFVYFGGYYTEMGLLLRQSHQAGLKVQFMGPEGVGNNDVTAIAGDAVEGLLATLPRAFDTAPRNKELVERIKAAKKDPSGAFVMPGYAALQVIAEGLKAAGSQEPAKVADAIRAGTFETPIGQVAFDNKGDLKSFDFAVYHWHKDGSRTAAE
ncbi:MAG: high-affinity branched-chain amino acid ABC transporter substrate-binding protein [Ottowia sp.]|nr:high-affinity branched-chain amino acid ABC transporter substrate-binding protein [Ottowia sp.]